MSDQGLHFSDEQQKASISAILKALDESNSLAHSGERSDSVSVEAFGQRISVSWCTCSSAGPYIDLAIARAEREHLRASLTAMQAKAGELQRELASRKAEAERWDVALREVVDKTNASKAEYLAERDQAVARAERAEGLVGEIREVLKRAVSVCLLNKLPITASELQWALRALEKMKAEPDAALGRGVGEET